MACLRTVVEDSPPWWVHKNRVRAEMELGQLSLGNM